jgi:hypothetical protein
MVIIKKTNNKCWEGTKGTLMVGMQISHYGNQYGGSSTN